MFQPRIIAGERAEPRWPDEQADEDEADDGGDAEARERRNDDACGTEDHQRVAEGRCFCF